MVRLATTGLFDFKMFDPWDAWCWRKLRWSLDELVVTQQKDVSQVQHNHWVTIASHGNLNDDSFELAKTNASAALNRILKAAYPWLADKIGKIGEQTETEELVQKYREIFGSPGEARYDKMIADALEAIRKYKATR